MSDDAVIKAVFPTYRPVPSRNCLQLVLEVPLEQQEQVFGALGFPIPGETIWVAVARLTQNPEVPEPPVRPSMTFPADRSPPLSSTGARHKDVAKSSRAKEWFAQLDEGDKVVAEAAMLCKDPAFRKWIGPRDSAPFTEEQAAIFVCNYCKIGRRRDLATDSGARQKFSEMLDWFQFDTGRIAEVRG